MTRRLRAIPPRVVDGALCAFFLALAVIDVASGALDGRAPAGTAMALGLLVALPAARRARPLGSAFAWSGIVVCMWLFLEPPYQLQTPFLGIFVYPFNAAVRATGRRALLGLAPDWIAVSAVALSSEDFIWGDIFFPGMFGMLFWLGGRAVADRNRLTEELHEEAVRAGEEREAAAARATADERRRIAREMHDVVAHSVSMMVVQAGGARRILARDPERAAEAAGLIETTGRAALAEMRHLLGVLHADDDHGAGFAPQPGLAGAEALAERVRAAGVPVTLEVRGDRPELPTGLDLAAYRVLQEALTNVLKHGGGGACDVVVDYRPGAVELRVTDRGGGARPAALAGSGAGLVGMRERVRMYGGELHAAPAPRGGFEVQATLPVEAGDAAALTAGAGA